jgi:hypothetical protein
MKSLNYKKHSGGATEVSYREVSLNKVSLFKESMGIGANVEATAAQFFLPFGCTNPCYTYRQL